ncbi:choice-of-anchor B family protein [Sphingobacteriales bacterium UPWRP_1]|nr:hypothetical protein BVG80_18705 [Sphingobacteriales bacterium TSM_CSM]PSJ73185.1 choice-of-anchor B family protein [Sphingobacteriales bacterium UPWRP_1]
MVYSACFYCRQWFVGLILFLFLATPLCLKAQNTNIALAAQVTYPDVMSSIWGFTKGGHEYVLSFRRTGTSIVDITNPAAPVEVAFIDGPDSDWREGKVWGNYAYVTNEAGSGLQIINFSNLPSGSVTAANANYWTGGTWSGGSVSFSTSHAMFIDENGIAYIYGTNYGNGGVIMANVAANPTNPPIVGVYNQKYVHDGFVRGDTLWAAQIYDGTFAVINVTNKANPVVMATQNTGSNFTHNTWLNDIGTHVFTTDETGGASVETYDITDLSDIKQVGTFNAAGSSAIPHNVHWRNGFVVIAYYRDGVVIADALHPEKLIQVGNYDTSPYSGSGYNGAWGVYPYFPSGTIVVSDIEEGLFVLTPTYIHASYLQGVVTNANTAAPVVNASIQVAGVTQANATSGFNGAYLSGMTGSGTFTVTVSASGFVSQTFSVTYTNGVTQTLNVALVPNIPFTATGQVTDAQTGLPLASAPVLFNDGLNNYTATTNATGTYSVALPGNGNYTISAGKWGYQTQQLTNVALSTASTTQNFALRKGYYDDFLFDFGWTVSGDASAGAWVRAEPIGTTLDGSPSNPETDVNNDFGNQCYVTGNATGAVGNADVDNGTTILTSPVFDLSTTPTAQISYYRWFKNGGGNGTPNDQMLIKLSNGTTTVTVQTIPYNDASQGQWVNNTITVADFITPTNNMRLIAEVSDLGQQHISEGGLDKFEVLIPPVVVQVSAWLGGAFSGGQMSTALATNNLLPLTQPYNQSPWNYAGAETVSTLPANVTDWVLLELRPFASPGTIAEQRAAFILKTGAIVDTDGAAGVKFYTLGQGGSYYIVLRHRNHLAVISKNPVSLPNAAVFSFSNATNVAGGTSQMVSLGGFVSGLTPADFDANGVITVDDFNYYTTQTAQLNTYNDADCSLDGAVTVADFNLFKANAGKIGMSIIRY